MVPLLISSMPSLAQVWLSLDDGVTFNSLLELSDHVISYSYNDQAVVLLIASGGLYFSRPGGQAFTRLSPISVHPLSRIVLDDSSTLRIIDLNNMVSAETPCSRGDGAWLVIYRHCALKFCFTD